MRLEPATPRSILESKLTILRHYLLVPSQLIAVANSLDQIQALTNRWSGSGSKLFDPLMVFLIDVLKKVNFENKIRKACKITQ